MDYPAALKLLSEGESVYREAWPPNEYVDSRFSPIRGIPDEGYPHMAENGSQFKLVRVFTAVIGGVGEEEQEETYTPSLEDTAADDWES